MDGMTKCLALLSPPSRFESNASKMRWTFRASTAASQTAILLDLTCLCCSHALLHRKLPCHPMHLDARTSLPLSLAPQDACSFSSPRSAQFAKLIIEMCFAMRSAEALCGRISKARPVLSKILAAGHLLPEKDSRMQFTAANLKQRMCSLQWQFVVVFVSSFVYSIRNICFPMTVD